MKKITFIILGLIFAVLVIIAVTGLRDISSITYPSYTSGQGNYSPTDVSGNIITPLPNPYVDTTNTVEAPLIVGGDLDIHGCKASAGYTWCSSNNKCIRSWEEPCEGTGGQASCGITNCHGTDIVCGTDVSVVCDMMYLSGDICRQYAQCEVVNGECGFVPNERFISCVACIEQCKDQNLDGDINIFSCESSCAQ